jgi:streptogramin lyase
MTVGHDGNLWFAELRPSRIARFSTVSTSSKGGHPWAHPQCNRTYKAWTRAHRHANRSQKKVEANKLNRLHSCPLSILK